MSGKMPPPNKRPVVFMRPARKPSVVANTTKPAPIPTASEVIHKTDNLNFHTTTLGVKPLPPVPPPGGYVLDKGLMWEIHDVRDNGPFGKFDLVVGVVPKRF